MEELKGILEKLVGAIEENNKLLRESITMAKIANEFNASKMAETQKQLDKVLAPLQGILSGGK